MLRRRSKAKLGRRRKRSPRRIKHPRSPRKGRKWRQGKMFRNLLSTSLCSEAGQAQLLQIRAFIMRIKKCGISSLLKHLTTCRSNPNKINDNRQQTLQATTLQQMRRTAVIMQLLLGGLILRRLEMLLPSLLGSSW